MLCVNSKLKAQNEAIDTINLQLRQLFGGLDLPSNPKKFLYEMSVKVSDSSFYQLNCPDTNNTDVFQRVYEEIYHSAYDTTLWPYPDSLFEKGMSFTNDTIPIGILTFSHYLLKPEAMSTGDYFIFDTVNTTLTDKYPRPGFPYNEGSIHIAAPLVSSTHFANPVFRIDPQFILFDSFNDPSANNLQLKVDFGDGNGWVSFDHTIVTHHAVTYTTANDQIIKIRWADAEDGGNTSTSRIRNPTTTVTLPPAEVFDYPGIHAGLYPSCNAIPNTKKGRTVIYLSGFDVMDFIPSENRTVERIFAGMINDNQVAQLRNNGYDFLVVDWKNSRIDLRFNALYLVNLIQQLKKEARDNGDMEQFVIMGESMGGVIARYALTYMESDDYQNHDVSRFFNDELDVNNTPYLLTNPGIYNLPNNWDYADAMHNTRLLITLDAPHQGANVPIAIQKGYQHAFNIFGKYVGFGLRTTAKMLNLFLDAQAAQQMLIYHVDTESGSGLYKTYSRHSDGDSFYGEITGEQANYPQFCKVVLMSNGALNGSGQTNFYTDAERIANDRLLHFNTELYGRVLWIKVPLFGGVLKLNTNPNGNGKVLQANAGRYGIRIKLKWFGIRIHIGYNSLFQEEDYANTKPYCTNSGGYEGEPMLVSGSTGGSHYNLSNKWLFNFFSYNFYKDGQGCVGLDSHVGLNGYFSVNFDFEMCSDGFHFNFVPTQSALDYGTLGSSPALGFNIQQNHSITTKLGNIHEAVDVIIGYPGGSSYSPFLNRRHLGYRNDLIRNITGLNAVLPQPGTGYTSNYEHTYYSCISETGQYDKVRRGFLNLEIGDEEMYLENNKLPWEATYVSEYDVHVNDRNPNYEYPNLSTPNLEGIYSREDDFIIENSGFAHFVYDAGNTPGIGFNFTNPNGNYDETNQPLDVCCENYSTQERGALNNFPKAPNVITSTAVSYIKVYPNPTFAGRQAIVKYKFKEKGTPTLSLFNLNGQILVQKMLPVADATRETSTVLDIPRLKLLPGMYLLRLHNGKEVLTSKIIISN